jgi:glycosyltransferase involved in cell wall biosynthesis
MGDVKKALGVAESALAYRPDEVTERNIAIYRAYLIKESLLSSVKDLVAVYGVSPFADTYVKETFAEIVALAPQTIRPEMPAFQSPVKTIAFACGGQWQPWNPSNPPGGSEIAIVELSKRFARRGYDVSVFSDPLLGGPTASDGVRWRGNEDPAEEFDLLIAWRGLDRLEQGRAKRRILWLHDIPVEFSTPKRLSMIDVVAVNSMWHADVVRPHLPGKRIEILGAGLDPSRFAPEKWPHRTPRNMRSCIWASSWDRGLDFMLEIWPRLRVKNAELHVLYGCDGSLNIARKKGDKVMEAKFLAWQKLIADTPGVVSHGRVPNDEYDRLFMASGVWAYPIPAAGNPWGETFCVGAAEALCAGLRVVVSPRGALAEVASPYAFRQVFGKREDATYRTAFAYALEEAMTDDVEGTREFIASEARARFDWDRVVDRWEERILRSS